MTIIVARLLSKTIKTITLGKKFYKKNILIKHKLQKNFIKQNNLKNNYL